MADKLSIRTFDFGKDYATICAWWDAHGSLCMKPEHLSQNGIIVEIESIPACVGFLYKTDSRLCAFEFVVSDPTLAKNIRDKALNFLILAAKEWTKINGFSLIYTSTSNQKYLSRLKAAGFIETDKGQTHSFFEVMS